MAFPVVWQKIKDLADKFSEYLPLSGGTMTGDVKFANGGLGSRDWINSDGKASKEVYIHAGADQTTESTLVLRRSDSELQPSSFMIRAGSGSDLSGNDAGSLRWRSQELERVAASGTGYVRYASGLQICWGGTGDNSSYTVTYPVAFSSAPKVFATVYTSKPTVNCVTGVNSATKVTIKKTASADGYWLAIGNWS